MTIIVRTTFTPRAAVAVVEYRPLTGKLRTVQRPTVHLATSQTLALLTPILPHLPSVVDFTRSMLVPADGPVAVSATSCGSDIWWPRRTAATVADLRHARDLSGLAETDSARFV
jgi:hypothetical protein